jgi:endonuclease YncB( thermonuclease family)
VRAAGIAALLVAMLALPVHAVRADEVHMPEEVPPPSRDVTPPGVTPAPITSGPLIREPLPPPPPEKPRWHRYFLPETTDAATFLVQNRTIRLAGVDALPRGGVCRLADGGNWPCGTNALFALRRFLGGRAIECFFMTKADAPESYAKAAEAAHCAGLGLWRSEAPPAACPATN